LGIKLQFESIVKTPKTKFKWLPNWACNASLKSFFKGFNSVCDSFLIEVHMHEIWIQNIMGFITWAKLGIFMIPYQELCNTFHHYSTTFIVVHKIYYKKI